MFCLCLEIPYQLIVRVKAIKQSSYKTRPIESYKSLSEGWRALQKVYTRIFKGKYTWLYKGSLKKPSSTPNHFRNQLSNLNCRHFPIKQLTLKYSYSMNLSILNRFKYKIHIKIPCYTVRVLRCDSKTFKTSFAVNLPLLANRTPKPTLFKRRLTVHFEYSFGRILSVFVLFLF